MAVGDIYLATFFQTLHGQTVLNTCHYRESTSAGSAGATTLAATLDGRIASTMKPVMSDEWHYDYTQVQKIYPGIVEYPVINGTGAGDGGLALAADATSVAIVFTKRTIYAGPRYRGRIFVTGFPRDVIDESQLGASDVATYTPVGGAMVGTVTSGGYVFDPVLYHKNDNTYHNIVAAVLRQTVRNQKRRQLRVGI